MKMKGKLELSKLEDVIKEYRKLCLQAHTTIPTYKELRSIGKDNIINKYVKLRNKLILE